MSTTRSIVSALKPRFYATLGRHDKVMQNPWNRFPSKPTTPANNGFPDGVFPYLLTEQHPAGKNSFILKFALPHVEGNEPLTTVGSRGVKLFVHGEAEDTGKPKILEKSYSVISPPSMQDAFELLVKGYDYRAGGGLGAFLSWGLQPGIDSAYFKIKKERSIFGVTSIEKLVSSRYYDSIGMVGGGTGVAPFIQIIRTGIEMKSNVTMNLLSVHREEEDILMKSELDALAAENPGRLKVTYHLTGKSHHESGVADNVRRGTWHLAKEALPRPDDRTLIMVCGADGFVSYWGGPVVKEINPKTGKKEKMQGPLSGVLLDAGYLTSMVYKY